MDDASQIKINWVERIEACKWTNFEDGMLLSCV